MNLKDGIKTLEQEAIWKPAKFEDVTLAYKKIPGSRKYRFEDGDYSGVARVYDTPSEYGIHDGRVSKGLDLYYKGKPVYYANEDHKEFMAKLLPYLDSLGFDEEALIKLSNYAFKSSIRTLESFNGYVNNMFKLGVINSTSIDSHIEDIVRNDSVIKKLLQGMGINREVNSTDRNLYKTWLYDWGLNPELIDYASTLQRINIYLCNT